MNNIVNDEDLSYHCKELHKYARMENETHLEWFYKVVRNKLLWHSLVIETNDDKECKPEVIYDGTFDEKYRYWYETISLTDSAPHSIDSITRRAKKNNWHSNIMRAIQSPVIPNYKDVYKNWSLCCFSLGNVKHNDYMWINYASNYQGIRFCFDVSNRNSLLGNAVKVIYGDDPVMLNLIKATEQDMSDIFRRKEKKWFRENEYRIIIRRPTGDRNIPDMKISRVAIGDKVSDVLRNLITAECKQRNIAVDLVQSISM